MPRRTEKSRQELEDVAFLSAAGWERGEIAARLKLSLKRVDKLKKAAVPEELLEHPRPRLGRGWTPEMFERVQARVADSDLTELIADWAKSGKAEPPLSLITAPSANRETTPEAWRKRLDVLGRACAQFVRQLIEDSPSVGVSWGTTLAAVVSAVEQLPEREGARKRAVWMIPVCGEPLGKPPTKYSASALAARLDEAVNGSRLHSLSLAAVPFLIPVDFTHEGPHNEVNAVRKLMARVPAHAQIFGGGLAVGAHKQRRPWVERLNMVLTSVGPAGRPFGYSGAELIESAGLEVRRVNEAALGDISGLLLERRGAGAKEKATIETVRRHWTGITLEQLKECARRGRQRASDGRRPAGVVVVAAGHNKAEVVVECLRHSLVTHLVIDQDLRERLKEILEAEIRERDSGKTA